MKRVFAGFAVAMGFLACGDRISTDSGPGSVNPNGSTPSVQIDSGASIIDDGGPTSTGDAAVADPYAGPCGFTDDFNGPTADDYLSRPHDWSFVGTPDELSIETMADPQDASDGAIILAKVSSGVGAYLQRTLSASCDLALTARLRVDADRPIEVLRTDLYGKLLTLRVESGIISAILDGESLHAETLAPHAFHTVRVGVSRTGGFVSFGLDSAATLTFQRPSAPAPVFTTVAIGALNPSDGTPTSPVTVFLNSVRGTGAP